MSIANYTELQTAVNNYLHRGDLVAAVPDFIRLAEAKANRVLRLLAMEQRADLTANTSDRFIDLPSGFLSASSLRIVVDGVSNSLTQINTADMDLAINDTAGQPELFSVTDKLEFERIADQAYSLQLRYFKAWDIAETSTNWLLTNCPDIYLYGALMQAAPYLKDDARISIWGSMLGSSINEMNDLDARSRSNQVAVVDSGLASVGRFTITSGDMSWR